MMAEKRFDVRVPNANTTLLAWLAQESRETGIGEARLLVLYATHYVEEEKIRRSGAFMLAAPIGVPASRSNGDVEEKEPSMRALPAPNSAVLASFLDEED